MSQITWLDPSLLEFPPVTAALEDPDGLLAAGGDLSVPRLLTAYQQGIFPWYEEGQPILWWSPNPRMVLLPEEFHIGRSLRKVLNKQQFTVSFDKDFHAVMEYCGETRAQQEGTWITAEMLQAYRELHRQGFAHSVEVWQDGRLVGGLYGVNMGCVFYGESMFSLVPNSSKVGFVHLVEQLSRWGCRLIDCQVETGYLASFGAKLISREAFVDLLRRYTRQTMSADFVPGSRAWQLNYQWPDVK